MDRRKSTLNLVDKCTFYVERAAIYLPLFASSMLEPAVGATMLVTLFVLTSLLTMLAYWKLHGNMNFSGSQQKTGVLYATERMAVLLFLCCGGKEGYRFLQFFLLQTSSIYLASSLTHKDTTLDEFPPILVGPCSASKSRVSTGSLPHLLEEKLGTWSPREVVQVEEQSDSSSEEGSDGGEVSGDELDEVDESEGDGPDEETESGHQEVAGKGPERDAEEETGNGLHRVEGDHLERDMVQEVERELVEQDAEEETTSGLEEVKNDDDVEKKQLGSGSSEQKGKEVIVGERKHQELHERLWKLHPLFEEICHKEQLEGRFPFLGKNCEKDVREMQRAHQEEIEKLCAEHRKERQAWETQRQALLKTIREQEARGCEPSGREYMEMMMGEWREEWESFCRHYREFCGEFGESVRAMKERNGILKQKLRIVEEEARESKGLLAMSEASRSALQAERDELAKGLLWATSMCNYYWSYMSEPDLEES